MKCVFKILTTLFSWFYYFLNDFSYRLPQIFKEKMRLRRTPAPINLSLEKKDIPFGFFRLYERDLSGFKLAQPHS